MYFAYKGTDNRIVEDSRCTEKTSSHDDDHDEPDPIKVWRERSYCVHWSPSARQFSQVRMPASSSVERSRHSVDLSCS